MSRIQRIWIIGSSGSGKTTLANVMGEKLNIPVFYNDKIFWIENWQERPKNLQIEITQKITKKDKWIYEGNRFNDCYTDGRYKYCDTIIFLNINRFTCLYRFIKRYYRYRGTVRPDISSGCKEKIDINIVKYILLDYPRKVKARQELFSGAIKEGKQVIIISGKKDLKKFIDHL